MLRQRTPIKRTPFRRHEPAVRREDRPLAPLARAERACTYSGTTSGQPIAKDNAVEHEGYRRLVASFPCKRCRIVGYSQAAHPPPTGKGIKEDDRECFPLCCTRQGEIGCHYLFDNYKLMPHDQAVEQAKQWGRETRAAVEAAGLWPKNLPLLSDQPEGATP